MTLVAIPLRTPPEIKSARSWQEFGRWGSGQDRFNRQVLAALRKFQREAVAPAPPSPSLATIGGKGNVKGPASSVIGDIATWNNLSGSKLADSGKLAADIVTGPGSAVDGDVVLFDGATGKIIKDSGVLGSRLVTASAVLTDLALVKGDGGSRGVQTTGWLVDSSNDITHNATPGNGVTEAPFTIQGGGTGVVILRVTGTTVMSVARYKGSIKLDNTQAGVAPDNSIWADTSLSFSDHAGNQVVILDASPHDAGAGGAGYVALTPYKTNALRFEAGQDGGDKGDTAPGISFVCDGSDGGSPAANVSGVSFIKEKDNTTGMSTFGAFTFRQTGVYISAEHYGGFMTTGAGDAMLQGITQLGRVCHHARQHSSYLDDGSRWQAVDGLVGGGFGFIDNSGNEPVTI
jgi:hypothetical protein